ncbi:hypothetical protein E2C01_049349 [Portunus trituberculatus]|uniref:Uncharacterized protein n=1 Tax=Portunus trituberculatus TaxID=210409 RepID=A0A5B7GFT8_PORTR|nr:hypothetical protein [Portunus trituberculatus]
MKLLGKTCTDGMRSQSGVTSTVSPSASWSLTLLSYIVHRYAHRHNCPVLTSFIFVTKATLGNRSTSASLTFMIT